MFFVVDLSVGFMATCPTGPAPSGATVPSCQGDGSLVSTLILKKEGPRDFAGRCRDDLPGQTSTYAIDWTGEAQQTSP